MMGPSNGPYVCEPPSVPIKRIGVPMERLERLGSALEHHNLASTRSGRSIDSSLERSCSGYAQFYSKLEKLANKVSEKD